MNARPFAPLLCALSVAAPGRAAASGAAIVSPTLPAALEFTSAAAPAPPPPRSHESMEYSVSYLGVPMGKVRLFVGKVDPSTAPVFLQAQTSSVLSFITLRQQLATYLDVDTGLPRRSTLDAVEGSYRHSDTVHFDREANRATVRVKGKYDNTYLVDMPPGTVDFVAMVFKLRNLPLEPGTRHEFSVLSGRRLAHVVAEVLGRETVKTKVGEFPALKVRVPTGFTGKFSEKNPTLVWFSDDDRRLVVRITSDFAVGHATASLVGYTPGAPPAPPAEPAIRHAAADAAAQPVPAAAEAVPAAAEVEAVEPAPVAEPEADGSLEAKAPSP